MKAAIELLCKVSSTNGSKHIDDSHGLPMLSWLHQSSQIGGIIMADGFELLAQNEKILYKALARAHIRQGDIDYDDWLSFARLQYLYHYQRRGELSDIVFNRGVGRLIYLDIEKQRGSILRDLRRASRVNETQETVIGMDITQLEVREAITEALAAMTTLHRRIFIMRFDDGLKQAEIARQLGISRQAVNNQMRKIREIIGKVLERE
jgi:RNA polymerase sigma factor (sigma-70 family)